MANTYSGPFGSCQCSGGNSFIPYMPTQQIFNSGSGTYTPPTTPRAPLYICVELWGAGAGGSGSARGVDGGFGSNGEDSTFGGILTAHGGAGGEFASGGIGGNCTISTSASGVNFKGQDGGISLGVSYDPGFSTTPNRLINYLVGGSGGNSQFAGAGLSGPTRDAVPNTGSGGAGADINADSEGITGTTIFNSGTGGGGGGYLKYIMPSASYVFSIGLGGSGGIAGTGGNPGGDGSNGGLIITEHYQ
jgi:hypothetical protein